MPSPIRTTALIAFSTLSLALGCAGAKPAPSATPAAADVAAVAKPEPQPAAVPESAPVAAEAPKPADEPRDGLRKASRPPLELLTGNNVVYVFNFAASAVGTTAKERCESQNDGDPAASRECLAKERGKVPVESVRFVKAPSGEYWWVTYNRYKGNLLKWHKVQFLPGKEDADSVSLNLTGKDKGIAPMPRVPAKLKIELPNDYSIVVSDPEHGDMMYDAKIGLMEAE